MIRLFRDDNFIILSSMYSLNYISSLINPSEGRQSNAIKHDNIYNFTKFEKQGWQMIQAARKHRETKIGLQLLQYIQATTLDIGARCGLCSRQSPVSLIFPDGKLSGKICFGNYFKNHYSDVIMGAMASQITSITIVYSTVYSGTD